MELFSIFGRILLKDDGVENKLDSVTKKAEEIESKLTQLGKKTAPSWPSRRMFFPSFTAFERYLNVSVT